MTAMKLTTPGEAYAELETNERAVYLDVRTVDEFENGHPAGSLNVPVMQRVGGMMRPNPDFVTVAETLLDKDQPVFCGCQAGGRSKAAAQMLINAGFTDVTNVLGGWGGGGDPRSGARVAGWREAGLPTTAGGGDERSHAALRAKAGLGE